MQHKPCPPWTLATDLGTGTVGVSKGEDRGWGVVPGGMWNY
jgi:hypothetical protein